jgi:hypothetical protein
MGFWFPSKTKPLHFTIRRLLCLETKVEVTLLHIYYLTVISKAKVFMQSSFSAKQTSLKCFPLLRLWEASTFPARWKM